MSRRKALDPLTVELTAGAWKEVLEALDRAGKELLPSLIRGQLADQGVILEKEDAGDD